MAELVERRGLGTVRAAMDELYAYSERLVRAAIGALPDGRGEAVDVVEAVEGELELRVAVQRPRRRGRDRLRGNRPPARRATSTARSR